MKLYDQLTAMAFNHRSRGALSYKTNKEVRDALQKELSSSMKLNACETKVSVI